jgi:glutamate-1-semialdehyde 2,1-aminomutase
MVWWGPFPLVMERADGCFLYDVDGNKYLDLVNNWTSMVLGNNPPSVVKAVKDSMDQLGMAMAAPTESAYQWAKLICDRMKSVDKVRFSCSGTEAAMFALRTARAFTGKDKIIKLSGGFHGSYDPIHFHVGWGEWEVGMPQSLKQDIAMIPPNDIDTSREIILANKEDSCAVIFEAVMGAGGTLPLDKEYVKFLREITTENGLLLIIDEVVTFRLAPGGAQEIYGIDADLTIFGKALASGMPNGAFGGRADIMELYSQASQASPLFHSGTFIATPSVAAAGIASLEAMTRPVLDRINQMGDDLADNLRAVFDDHGVKAQISGIGSLHQLHWREAPLRSPDDGEDQALELKPIFNKLMLKRGKYVSARNYFMMSTPMGQSEMDDTVQAVSDTLAEMKPLIEKSAPQLLK